MSQVTERIDITANTAGLDAAAKKIDQLAAQMAAAGVKMPKSMRQGFMEIEKASLSVARATAAVTKETDAATKRMASMTRQAEAIQRQYDTSYKNAIRQAGVETNLNRLVEVGAITRQRANDVLQMAAVRHGQIAKAAGGVNDNVRLTSGQIQSLGYQLNDVATMLALGASPFQIMASQAGQVVQVLQDGPQGLKGSLKAIGTNIASFARAIPTAGYVVGGLTAAVGALWYLTSGPDARSAKESVEGFEGAVKRLEGRWKGAADAAREHYANAKNRGDSPTIAFLDTGAELAKLRTDLKATVNDLDTSDLLSGRILRPFSGAVSDARKEISAIYTDLRKGTITADQAAEAMLGIRIDPNADGYARKFAEEIRRALAPVQDLEHRIQALNNSMAQLAAPKGAKGRIDPTVHVFEDRFGDADTAMNDIREKLTKQKEDLGNVDEASRAYSKTISDQRAAIADSVAGLQLQVDYFGRTEGAMAAARMQADLLAEAERNAADAKQTMDPAFIGFIRQQAEQYGTLTDRLHDLNAAQEQRKRLADLDADLRFDLEQTGRSEIEQRVAATFTEPGITYEGEEP